MLEMMMTQSSFESPPTESTSVGQILYALNGTGLDTTYDFIVPDGVYSISSVVVGGGEGSLIPGSAAGKGGNGGNLRWKNAIRVTPGEVLKITVGGRGDGTRANAILMGGNSSIKRSDGTTILLARGGGNNSGEETTVTSPNAGGGNGGVGLVGLSGRGGGGGGAGGYTGNGGGGGNQIVKGTAGQGGGGGGGAGYYYPPYTYGSAGGGVGVTGAGLSGVGGVPANNGDYGIGKPGSGAPIGTAGSIIPDKAYGAGAGSISGTGGVGYKGGPGAVRIIWGTGRAFPSTLTADQPVTG